MLLDNQTRSSHPVSGDINLPDPLKNLVFKPIGIFLVISMFLSPESL
jgi:hypothetical protein